MYIDHAVIWVENAERSLDFYVNSLGFDPVREEEFSEGKAHFPSVRINKNTIFDIMEPDKLLPLVQKFTGGGEGIGGHPINHICLSMSHQQYDSIIDRLEARGVKLTPGGEDVFGAQGQAVRSTYFNDPDGNVLEIRFYEN
jgi:catechol 2,3-dioxygenase-like lactoylglutathione lyase family enzyme